MTTSIQSQSSKNPLSMRGSIYDHGHFEPDISTTDNDSAVGSVAISLNKHLRTFSKFLTQVFVSPHNTCGPIKIIRDFGSDDETDISAGLWKKRRF